MRLASSYCTEVNNLLGGLTGLSRDSLLRLRWIATIGKMSDCVDFCKMLFPKRSMFQKGAQKLPFGLLRSTCFPACHFLIRLRTSSSVLRWRSLTASRPFKPRRYASFSNRSCSATTYKAKRTACSSSLSPLSSPEQTSNMAEEIAAAGMEIDTAMPQQPAAPETTENKPKPRFEIKKYNAVALWAWGKWNTFWRRAS